jgi:hypothetical protein
MHIGGLMSRRGTDRAGSDPGQNRVVRTMHLAEILAATR